MRKIIFRIVRNEMMSMGEKCCTILALISCRKSRRTFFEKTPTNDKFYAIL